MKSGKTYIKHEFMLILSPVTQYEIILILIPFGITHFILKHCREPETICDIQAVMY